MCDFFQGLEKVRGSVSNLWKRAGACYETAMKSFRVSGSCVWAAAALFIALGSGLSLRAMNLDVYELDSLAYLAAAVVEGEISSNYVAHGKQLVDFKISLALKGDFKPGQHVAVGATDDYRKTNGDHWNWCKLAVGDRLAFFLVRLTSEGLSTAVPTNTVIFRPLTGGVRLLDGERVLAFFQEENPGPYVARAPKSTDKTVQTLAQFRDDVRASLRRTPELARLVMANPDKPDVPRLLQLLAKRAQRSEWLRDYFSEQLCDRLAQRRAFAALGEALALARTYREFELLRFGFATPEGRDFLLAKVQDETEPLPSRQRYAEAIFEAGFSYRVKIEKIGSNEWDSVGEVDAGNSGYLTRIAKAARATEKHSELCLQLLEWIECVGNSIAQDTAGERRKDFLGALAVLKEFRAAQPAADIRAALEKVLALEPNAAAKPRAP